MYESSALIAPRMPGGLAQILGINATYYRSPMAFMLLQTNVLGLEQLTAPTLLLLSMYIVEVSC